MWKHKEPESQEPNVPKWVFQVFLPVQIKVKHGSCPKRGHVCFQFSENGFAAGVLSPLGRLYALPRPQNLAQVTMDAGDHVQAIVAALWTDAVVQDDVSEVRNGTNLSVHLQE